MDIYNEITRLPQYYYEWKSGWVFGDGIITIKRTKM